jgi:ribosomal protein L32
MVANSSRIGCRYQRLGARRREEYRVNVGHTARLIGSLVNFTFRLEERRTGRVDRGTAIAVSLCESTGFYHHYHRAWMCVPSGFGARLKHSSVCNTSLGPFTCRLSVPSSLEPNARAMICSGLTSPRATCEPNSPSASAATAAAAPAPPGLLVRRSHCLDSFPNRVIILVLLFSASASTTRRWPFKWNSANPPRKQEHALKLFRPMYTDRQPTMGRDVESRPPEEITELLQAWSRGDQGAFDQLASIVYSELRRLARRYMARERPDHTLQPTALVHEAYMRLANFGALDWKTGSISSPSRRR